MGVEGLEGVGSSRKAEPVAGGVRLVFKTARDWLASYQETEKRGGGPRKEGNEQIFRRVVGERLITGLCVELVRNTGGVVPSAGPFIRRRSVILVFCK